MYNIKNVKFISQITESTKVKNIIQNMGGEKEICQITSKKWSIPKNKKTSNSRNFIL